jgi:hypothetical protein
LKTGQGRSGQVLKYCILSVSAYVPSRPHFGPAVVDISRIGSYGVPTSPRNQLPHPPPPWNVKHPFPSGSPPGHGSFLPHPPSERRLDLVSSKVGRRRIVAVVPKSSRAPSCQRGGVNKLVLRVARVSRRGSNVRSYSRHPTGHESHRPLLRAGRSRRLYD